MARTVPTNLTSRYAAILDALRAPRDPIAKEMRAYPVSVDPYLWSVCSDLSASLGARNLFGATSTTRSTVYDDVLGEAMDTFSISELDGILLEPVVRSVMDERTSQTGMRVKISHRVHLMGNGRSLLETAATVITAFTTPDGVVPDLRDVLPRLDPRFPVHVLDASWEPGTYLNDLLMLLNRFRLGGRNGGSEEAVREFQEKYTRDHDLEMKTRLYLSRADERAFIVDRRVSRALAGATLSSLITPKSAKVEPLSYGGLLKAQGKNMVDRSIVARSDQRRNTLELVQADISSFTSSDLNAIVVVLAQLLALESGWGGDVNADTRITLNVHGCLLRASLRDIFILYLYLVPFTPVRVVERGLTYTPYGTSLGVCGSIATCTHSYVLTVKRILSTMWSRQRIYAQIGGDDVLFWWLSDRTTSCLHHAAIRAILHEHVGHVKEYVTATLGVEQGDWESGVTFCKKAIRYTVTTTQLGLRYRIYSARNLPILLEDILRPPPVSLADQTRCAEVWVRGMVDACKEFPEAVVQEFVWGMLWMRSVVQQGVARPLSFHTDWVFQIPSGCYAVDAGTLATPRAFGHIAQYRPLTTADGVLYGATPLARLQLLCQRGVLQQLRVGDGGSYLLAVTTQEAQRFVATIRRPCDATIHATALDLHWWNVLEVVLTIREELATQGVVIEDLYDDAHAPRTPSIPAYLKR